MKRHSQNRANIPAPVQHNAVVRAKGSRRGVTLGKRARGGQRNDQVPFVPPEDWHESVEGVGSGYKIIEQDPGESYRHVVTPVEIHRRLGQLPQQMLRPLEVIQLSRMTRKKQSLPCYGMQWGTTLYLYPIEQSLVEFYPNPPKPSQLTETNMYGGRWVEESSGGWKLVWTEQAIKDFYLNNILIHELGHLLDSRNSSYVDRERYAEWFAIQHGYKTSRNGTLAKRAAKRVVRRHHCS